MFFGEARLAKKTELKKFERVTARDVWRKKFGIPLQDAKEKARQMRSLQSRGFGFEVIARGPRPEESSDS